MTVEFFIPGTFKAKGRPRFDSRSGHTFTPKDTQSYEAVVRKYAKDAMSNEPMMDGPLTAKITFIFPRPKSKKLDIYNICRPDVDNCAKTILDAMNGIVYKDDSAVTRCLIEKFLQVPVHLIGIGVSDVPPVKIGVRVEINEIRENKWAAPMKADKKRAND